MAKQPLPKGWKSVKLSELADKCIAKNRDFKYNLVLTNSAISGIIPQSEHFDKDIAVDENIDGYFIVNNGDFVYNPRISTTAPCGPIRRNHLGKTGVMSPLYTVFKLEKDNIDDSFIEYYFLSSGWYRYMKSIANYGARHDRMSITDDAFFDMHIPLPPLHEQKAIAEILSTADNLITVKQRLITAKQNQKQWLMQNLLTGKIRLPGFSGEWERVKLGEGIFLQRGYDLPKIEMNRGEYPVIASNGIIGYHDKFTSDAPSITVGRSGSVGNVFFTNKRSWTHNTALYVKQLTNVYPYYAYYLLSFLKLEKYAGKSAVPTLNRNDVHSIDNDLPPLPEQQAIAKVLTTADREIELLSKELEQQKRLKKYLMQQLLTGKIRVKGVKK